MDSLKPVRVKLSVMKEPAKASRLSPKVIKVAPAVTRDKDLKKVVIDISKIVTVTIY